MKNTYFTGTSKSSSKSRQNLKYSWSRVALYLVEWLDLSHYVLPLTVFLHNLSKISHKKCILSCLLCSWKKEKQSQLLKIEYHWVAKNSLFPPQMSQNMYYLYSTFKACEELPRLSKKPEQSGFLTWFLICYIVANKIFSTLI